MNGAHLLIGLALITLLAGGCTHVNVARESDTPNATRATMQIPDDQNGDGFFVGLALSGGGSRSANFAAACMFELQRLGILQRVDCISSVSGGSIPAAYYCLNEADWNAVNVRKRMTHPFATDLLLTVLQPWNLAVQLLTSWDRADVLAESFKTHLYSRQGKAQTFADLLPSRPRLLINATDLQSGKRFVFSNESFDAINTDFSKYPISYAVAASSAVPALLHHVTLRDFSTDEPRYVHVLDGGIIDNLGVSTLVEVYVEQVRRERAAGRADPYPGGMILVVIDANTTIENKVSEDADVGLLDSLAVSIGLSSTALLNRASNATMAELIVQYSPDDTTAVELRRQIKTLVEDGSLMTVDPWRKPLRVVHLALPRLAELSDQAAAAEMREVNNIATYFNIGDKEAASLYAAAKLLVNDRRFAVPLGQIVSELNVGTLPAP